MDKMVTSQSVHCCVCECVCVCVGVCIDEGDGENVFLESGLLLWKKNRTGLCSVDEMFASSR